MSTSIATRTPTRIARSAEIDDTARFGQGATVWGLAQVRENAQIGADCIIGRGVYVDHDVSIGDRTKIQNNALIYWPARLASGVFIGPGAILANDRNPRAINPDGTLKTGSDYEAAGVTVDEGASIGAGAVVVAGVTIGAWAMVGAGAVVTKDVAPYELVVGSPARRIGWVGTTGHRLAEEDGGLVDPASGDRYSMTDEGLVAKP